MMADPRYRKALRVLYVAILQTYSSASDLKFLARELRSGRVSDELSYMLEQLVPYFGDESRTDEDDQLLERALAMTKARKVTRQGLLSLLGGLGFKDSDQKASAQVLLRRFFADASRSEANRLLELLGASSGPDPYLRGIADSRK